MGEHGLTQDYAAHELFTFSPVPEGPWLRNRVARMSRWCNIAFSQSWLAALLYRVRVRLSDAGVPALPLACDVVSRAMFRVQIGRRVSIGPGLMVPHGNVVIDGETTIGADCQINPWVTIGLTNSRKVGFSTKGPAIGDHVHIGTGAKILGPLTVGNYARIGANAVVLSDVPAHATAVGAPARVVAVSGAARSAEDRSSVSRLRLMIIDYRLHRCSLEELVRGLRSAPAAAMTDPGLARMIDALDSVRASSNGDVSRMLDAIERALPEAH